MATYATDLHVTNTATFSVIPTAPTAAVGDNSLQLATTAFVLANTSSSLTSYTFIATAGQTDFVTTGTTLSATPLVFLDGALQQITATYTVSGLTVTFINPRTALDSIVIVG
jgi:arginine exporter protein ArgO